MRKTSNQQIPSRFYKIKNPYMKFFCPLCKSPRQLRNSPRMSIKNYLQIMVGSLFICTILYPFMKERVFFTPLVVYAVFEFFKRVRWRNELPCPHCGFDARWYKRNVVTAKNRVVKFWEEKNSINNVTMSKTISNKLEETKSEQSQENLDEMDFSKANLEPVQDIKNDDNTPSQVAQ